MFDSTLHYMCKPFVQPLMPEDDHAGGQSLICV